MELCHLYKELIQKMDMMEREVNLAAIQNCILLCTLFTYISLHI